LLINLATVPAHGGSTQSSQSETTEDLRETLGQRLGPFPLYDSVVPNAKSTRDKEHHEQLLDMDLIRDVSRPTYTVYEPPVSRATDTAILVFPGGGYLVLAWEAEGQRIARAFQDRGVTAVLVRYRLPSDETMTDKTIGPLQDAQQAILQVRRHATDWKINRQKVGAIGFSAGGHLASMLGTQFDQVLIPNPDRMNVRPSFLILVYPIISFVQGRVHPDVRRALIGEDPADSVVARFSSDRAVSVETPPTLLMAASNDSGVGVDHTIDFYRALRAHQVPAQLVLFDRGEHGFFQLRQDEWTSVMWMWMDRNGYLTRR
jgi:acetyl esterase/lipase